MTLVRYNPHRFFDTAFDRLFSEFLPAVAADAAYGNGGAISPRVEIREEEDKIVLSAEIPGVAKDELKIEVDNRLLTLSGEKKEERESKENGVYRSERSYGAFRRSFTLPEAVDVDKISARTEDGVLRLELPKKPEAKPKVIAVEGHDGTAKKIAVS